MVGRIVLRCAATLAATIIGSAGLAQGTGAKHLKEGFYGNFPMGTLAWIRDADTEDEAKRFRRSFHVLRDQTCYEFPHRPAYWIAINHRDTERVGEPGFASIKLIYELPASVTRSRLFLSRNSGWITDQGRVTKRKFESSSAENDMDPREFFVMHSASELTDVESRTRRHMIQSNTGGFHAYVERESFDSWNYAHLLKDDDLGIPSGTSFLADVLHHRFTVTARKNSTKPVIFKLNRYASWNAKGVRIVVDMPKALGMRDRVIKRIKFYPHKCPV